jgi:hypothetical protein
MTVVERTVVDRRASRELWHVATCTANITANVTANVNKTDAETIRHE